MSFAKRMIELEEQQRDAAIEVAVQAGVLKRCYLHSELYDPLIGDKTAAYKLANYLFSAGKMRMFSDRTEMTDTIKSVVEDTPMECYTCAKWASED